jgi:type IV pilus assembly protein PilM
MILGKKDSLVGLDIGSRSVKVAEITETKNGRKLRRFGVADIPPGAVEDGAISDPETVAQIIRQLFKSANIKATNVALSIGGYSVIIKKINVQTMSEEQLQETSFRGRAVRPRHQHVNLVPALGEIETTPAR